MSSPANCIINELRTNKLYLQEALDYFVEKGYQLSREELLELIEEILKIDIFRWLNLVGYILRNIAAPDERFFGILLKVISKTNRDLTQPILIQDLVQIGFDNPELGLTIYKKAREMNNPDVLLSCRWIVGGIGKKNFELIHKDVLECLKSTHTELRILAITAIRVSFAEGIAPNWEKKVLSLLESSREDTDQKVKTELLNTYITFYNYAKEPCFTGIVELSKQNIELKYLASNLLLHPSLTKQHYAILVNILAENYDQPILENVLFSIHNRAEPEFIENELDIIQNILNRYSFFDLKRYPLDDALNKMGAVDLEACLARVYSWSKDRNTRIRYSAPRIAVEFGRHDFDKLVENIVSIMDQEELMNFTFETSRILLEEIYERSSEGKNISKSDQNAINILLEKLKRVAQSQGLDSDEISNREQSIIFKCLILIEAMQHHEQNIDYETIWHNLEYFPNLTHFLGEKWFKRMETEQNSTHPLLIFLSDRLLDEAELERKIKEIENLDDIAKKRERFHINDSIRTRALLIHIENAIDSIKERPSLKTVKASLRREEHFWKALSEIDVMSRLIRGPFQIERSPSLEIQEGKVVKLKHPDFHVTFEDTEAYIEVISPDMFGPLRYFHVAGIPNRVRGKITEEIKNHFKGMKNPKDVIIIVDFGSSEMRYDNIQDYVDGELQFVLRINQETRETIGVFTQRGEPMTEKDEGTRLVIGIIGYARVVGTDGKIHLKGRKFLNRQSSGNPKSLENISKWLLG